MALADRHPSAVRVLLLFSGAHVGGAERNMLRLIDELDRSRFHVVVATVGAQGDLIAKAKEAGVSAVACGPASARWFSGASRLIRDVKAFRPHVAYVFGMRAAFAIGVWLCRVFGARFVGSQRSTEKQRSWYLLQRLLVLLTGGRIVSNSRAGADALLEIGGLAADRVHVIRNGVDCDDIDRRIRAIPPRQTPGPVILNVANLVECKGQLDLLHAAERLVDDFPSLRVHLVGRDFMNGKLQAEVARRGALRHRVVFEGFRDDIYPFLARADVVAHPSHREGMPTAVLEALAAGCTVVATDVGGTRELVRDGETGLLVPPQDVDALAAAMRRLLEDRELRERLGQGGRDHVARCFSIRQMVIEHEELFAELAGIAGDEEVR